MVPSSMVPVPLTQMIPSGITLKDLHKGEAFITIEIAKGVTIDVDRNYVYADSSQAIQR